MRESWIDVLKGIGIILVVIGHTSMENPLVKWIYVFHMPLFFALSGYMFGRGRKQYTFAKFTEKRTKSLLLPFIIFRILLVIYWIIIESHFRNLDLGPIWFLIVLYIVELAAYIILEKISLYVDCLFVLGVFCILYYILLQESSITGWKAWEVRIINVFIWYVVGAIVGKFQIKWNEKRKLEIGLSNKIFILICLFFIYIWSGMSNSLVSMWSNCFGKYPLWIIGNVSGSLFIACLCKWVITESRIIEWYGRYTIIILATHEPIKRVILKCSEILLNKCNIGITTDNLQTNIITSLIVVAMVMIIEILVIKIFQWIKSRFPESIQKNWLGWIYS